ncbi:MAG TPA: DedA family protein [Solirubrobacteraceae bacterium]|jgi:membrane protein DedA with SNARE-associated domain
MTALIQSFGPFGVFLLMVPESAGIPVPSEVTLIFSGFAVSQHWMSFALAVLAATAGNVLGSLIAYAIGASGVLARVPGGRLVLGPAERLLDRRGVRAVFVARLLPLARTFVSLPAGARRVPIVPFVLLTTVGCALWAVLFVIVGVISGSAWSAVSSVLGKALLGAGLLVVAWILVRRPHTSGD